MMRISVLVCVAVLLWLPTRSQEILTREFAVAQLLNNNFNIQLAENDVDLASVNASKANAGFYPTIQLSGGASTDYGSANQKFQDGREIQADANLTQVYNGSVAVNYNLYQGGERRLNLQRLYQQVELAEVQKQVTIESQIVELMSVYYEAAQALEAMKLQRELTEFSKERLDRVLTNFEYGRSTRLDISNAEVDLRRDTANLINARMRYDQAKRNLLLAMGSTGGDLDFDVETEVSYNLALAPDQLVEEAIQRNSQLELIDQNGQLLNFEEDILSARQLPVLSFSSDYTYNFQDFGEGGFFAQQSSNGVGVGLGLSWNIYDGGRIKNQKQAIRVQKEGINIQRDQLETQIAFQIRNLYANYSTSLELVEVERESIRAAEQSFSRTRDEYQLGRLGQIEFRQSQINLLNAELAERTATYNAKIIEIQIMQLAGKILEEDYNY